MSPSQGAERKLQTKPRSAEDGLGASRAGSLKTHFHPKLYGPGPKSERCLTHAWEGLCRALAA